jgi:hypothetical protein
MEPIFVVERNEIILPVLEAFFEDESLSSSLISIFCGLSVLPYRFQEECTNIVKGDGHIE